MRITALIFLLATLTTSTLSAQKEPGESGNYLNMQWKNVATKMPAEWYGSEEAKQVAENVLLSQKDLGGWEKNKEFHQKMTEADQAHYKQGKPEPGGTFDNNATTTELRFLAKVYAQWKDERYKQAFEKGLDYIFKAQYENGGWPQFFPVRAPGSVAYSGHITYNDNAMVNIMLFLQDIFSGDAEFAALQLTEEMKSNARTSFYKGVDCILKTQIMVDNKPTVWCAQHDEITLAPAKARKYELESFSGAESVGITKLLMSLDNPSKEVIASIDSAIEWFENHKIEGARMDTEIGKDGKKNKIVVADKDALPVWARFYDLQTGKPFFCDRDGIKVNTLAEIGYERRNGYSWYTYAPAELLKKYPKWREKWEGK